MIKPKVNWMLSAAVGAVVAYARGTCILKGAAFGFAFGFLVHILASWPEINHDPNS